MAAMLAEQLPEPPGRAAGRARREGRARPIRDCQEMLRAGLAVALIQPSRAEIKKVAVRAVQVGL
jgi:hypothetical protein